MSTISLVTFASWIYSPMKEGCEDYSPTVASYVSQFSVF